jgi:NSS family neurotransmitter:Na+ symporter
MSYENQPRPYWSSMTSYLLVTAGAIVGLGNLIYFPLYVYKFGGLFILLFILCELLVSVPILLAELVIGRRGKQNPVGSFSILALESGASQGWRWLGWLSFIILFLTLADYMVSIASPVAYFSDILHDFLSKNFRYDFAYLEHSHFIDHFFFLEICFLAFLFITMLVILRGINRGLETISKITVPLYFFILLGLAIYSCFTGDFKQALNFLFTMKPSESFATVFFVALAYAFFKLNVGMGCMIVYGSYLPYSVPIGRSTFIIVCFDAVISLLSYFVIYPLFVASNEISGAHPFREILFFFSHAPNGDIIALFFFLAIIIAAWTPTIAIAEAATVTLIERFNLSRRVATLLVFTGAAFVGTAIVLSRNVLADFLVFNYWTIKEFISGLTNNILIPISAFLTSVFAGWIITRKITFHELDFRSVSYTIWRFFVRIVAPIAIWVMMVIFVQ